MYQNSLNAHRNQKNARGFTLVETLVALSLSVLIVLGMSQVFIQGLGHIHGVRAQVLLTSDAGYMVQMIRNELFLADAITVHTTDPEVSLALESGTSVIRLDPVRESVTLNGVPITRDGVAVTNLVFEKFGRSLRIQFTFNSGPRTNRTFTGQTTLALRR